MKTLYAGIDVSKAKLDLAVIELGKRSQSYGEYANDKKGISKLHSKLRGILKKTSSEEIRIAVESTGKYSNQVVEYLCEKDNIQISCVNPSRIKSFGKTMMIRTKTDRVDAQLIASFCQTIQPEPAQKISKTHKQLQVFSRYRAYLIEKRAQEKTFLEAAEEEMIQKSVEKTIDGYTQEIDKIDSQIEQILAKDEQLGISVKLLKSIPGISQLTACTILTEIHPENGRGKYSKKVQSAHAGLAPSKRESGLFQGKERISKMGNSRLRRSLYMPTMSAIKCNPIISAFYQRLIDKNKKKKVALVACMRKLLMISIGVLNVQKPFDPNWVPHLIKISSS